MEFRGVCVLLGVLLLSHCSFQQTTPKKKPVKKDTSRDAAVVDLQKQIDDIVQELNLLKEQQALQTDQQSGAAVVGRVPSKQLPVHSPAPTRVIYSTRQD